MTGASNVAKHLERVWLVKRLCGSHEF